MGISFEEDQKRKVVELALKAARSRLSSQTGYVHFYIEDPFFIKQDTIAILENFYYVHALFRSKLIENVQEGKTLLEKLLAFEVNGNFPIYLHDYPLCKDAQFSSSLLPIFFHLTRDFSFALGDALREKIESLSERIVNHLKSITSLSKSAESKLLAFLGKFKEDTWQPEGPVASSEWCIAAQMAGISLDGVANFWDPKTLVFIGQTKERFQEGLEPALTLFDLFMCESFQEFSSRALISHPVHLRASIVHPTEKKTFESKEDPFIVLIEEEKRQPLTIYWKEGLKTYSLVVEAKKGSWEINQSENKIYLSYAFDKALPGEEESVECAIFVAAHPDIELRVNEEKATVFRVNDAISIRSLSQSIQLSFLGEEGDFLGHISKGNRSFQKKAENHTAFDWKIGWRTIRRDSKAEVNLIFSLT